MSSDQRSQAAKDRPNRSAAQLAQFWHMYKSFKPSDSDPSSYSHVTRSHTMKTTRMFIDKDWLLPFQLPQFRQRTMKAAEIAEAAHCGQSTGLSQE
jgi:hypothetical protein